MISKCTCSNTFQDKTHGAKMRVFVLTIKNDGNDYTCTVCSKTKTISKRKNH